MADLRDHACVVQYTSVLDSLHGVSWGPPGENGFHVLRDFMGEKLSGGETVGCGFDPKWLDCIILRSTLARSIVAYLESVPWASLTAAGLCEMDTSFCTAMHACRVLGRLLIGALSQAGRSSLRGALLLTQVFHHPLFLADVCRISVITGATFACIPFQSTHSVIHQFDRYSR